MRLRSFETGIAMAGVLAFLVVPVGVASAQDQAQTPTEPATEVASVQSFTADLKGESEVPPVDSAGTGQLEAKFDASTATLSWSITFEGLSGDATAGHFHGPAGIDATAGPIIAFDDLTSPIEGSAELTDEQVEQINQGMWYVNIHTAEHPDGEIRGQVIGAE